MNQNCKLNQTFREERKSIQSVTSDSSSYSTMQATKSGIKEVFDSQIL